MTRVRTGHGIFSRLGYIQIIHPVLIAESPMSSLEEAQSTAATTQVSQPTPAPKAKKKRHVEPEPPATDPAAFRAIVEGRRSVRKFTKDPVPDAVLNDCIDLALLAPNSSNLQPWEFVVVKSPELRAKLAVACMDQNAAKTAPILLVQLGRTQTWDENAARILSEWHEPEIPKQVQTYYGKLVKFHYATGPLNAFGLTKRLVQRVATRIRPMPHSHYSKADIKTWAAKSCALACENFMLAARAHGYDTCPMEGFDETRVRQLIPMADDAFVVMIIAMGKRTAEGVYYPRQRFDRARMVREL
jgi:nitroreductase